MEDWGVKSAGAGMESWGVKRTGLEPRRICSVAGDRAIGLTAKFFGGPRPVAGDRGGIGLTAKFFGGPRLGPEGRAGGVAISSTLTSKLVGCALRPPPGKAFSPLATFTSFNIHVATYMQV